jgi:hypothetical protein
MRTGGWRRFCANCFPTGAVVRGDIGAAAARVTNVLAARTPVVEHNTRFLLANMQAQTLQLYGALV